MSLRMEKNPMVVFMNEIPLFQAPHLGVNKLNQRGPGFKPDMACLFRYFDTSSAGTSGVIALLTPANEPTNNNRGYDLVRLSTPEVPSLGATVDDIWSCAKEHYGLTAATVATGAGSVPISKMRLGHYVHPGSSKYSNLVSHLGLKFFPLAKLPHGSAAACVAKSAFGTIRIFGIVGRGLPFVSAGLAVYDAISIGLCAYEAQRER
jgi:hypothetical protein